MFFSLASIGQDSCKLSFIDNTTTITTGQKSLVDKFIGDRKIESVSILANISDQDGVSRNRIVSELRILAAKELLLNKGVPFNLMSTSLILEEGVVNSNQLELKFMFSEKVDDKVLKKTPVVQISEIEYVVRKSAPIVEEEKKKPKVDPIVEVAKNEILSVEEFKKDELISLPNLLFEPGTHFLLPGSERVLKELLNVMLAKPKLRIELQGHICCRLGGMDGFDPTTGRENLSEMRAKVVYLFLISRGVKKYRMTYIGFGSGRKLYPDLNSVSAQTLNRRVEVLVTSTE